MDAEITPEPTPDEREALLAVLGDTTEEALPPLASRWRASGIVFEDDYDGTARPRSRRGATRA